jgi:hypothetical protein
MTMTVIPRRRQRRRPASLIPRMLLAASATLFVLAGTSAASTAAFTARLQAPNHAPVAGKPWPITVTATRGATKLSGTVRYRFLFGGQAVSTQPGHAFTKGVYHDTLVFPAQAIGSPLTLQVIVATRYGTVDLDWAVTTRL